MVGRMQITYENIEKTSTVKASEYPTGYEIWEEVNNYRKSLGIPPMVMDEKLCNNIAQRAIDYEKNNTHEGLTEFHAAYMPEIINLSEVLNYGRTAEEVVNGWRSSPSHNLMITQKARGCSYSNRGYSVILMN